MVMIIAIHGRAGSGKSSVAKALAKKLGFRHYSIGDLRRRMACERGLTLAEFNKLGERESFTDEEVDRFQEQLGKSEDNFVIDGRTCFHFIPQSVKIYLYAKPAVRAQRVFADERKTERFKSLEEVRKALAERERSDERRYRKYYNLDVHDRKNFDLFIDTTNIPVEEVVGRIMEFLEKRKVTESGTQRS